MQFNIKTKIISAFMLVSLIPLAIVSYLACHKANQALEQEAILKFSAVQETMRSHLQDFSEQILKTMATVKNDPVLVGSYASFYDAFRTNDNSVENDIWKSLVDFKEAPIKALVANNNFVDLLLISPDGDIVYSVAREKDLGQNINEGTLQDSTLAQLFNTAVQAEDNEKLFSSDFSAYSPIGGEQSMFILGRMTLYNEFKCIVAIRLNAATINKIIQLRTGMGKTGETYLVGMTGQKVTLRTDQVIRQGRAGDPETAPFARLALEGQSGYGIQTNADGQEEFVSYAPANVPNLNWGMMTTASVDEVFEASKSLKNTMIVVTAVVVACVIGLALALAMVLFKPIRQTVAMLKDIAEGEGDLTRRLEKSSQDEMGEMAEWFNQFIHKIHDIITQIMAKAESLTHLSSGLDTLSGEMTKETDTMSGRTGAVTDAAREMTASIQEVAQDGEQASANLNLIASAIEEMTATASEIAGNTEKARSITENAVTRTHEATEKIMELGEATQKISTVTEVISDISAQINLLALNATIEAARAGEAGRGFAVVANEIKDLAAQTASATLEISQRIDGIQASSSSTVDQIKEISDVIDDVNAIVAGIATSVEEQSVTSREIAGNVADASSNIETISQQIHQSTAASATVSEEIHNVDKGVRDVADASSEVKSSATDLSGLAADIEQLVGQFKV